MLGTDLTLWATELAAALDVSVEVEPRDLVLPGILITPGPFEFDRLDGNLATAEVELWMIAGDTNTRTALDELTDLLLKVRQHFGDSPSAVEPITVTLPSQAPDPLPAFRCTLITDLDLTKGETQNDSEN